MRNKEIKKCLEKELEVPWVVQERVKHTLDDIRLAQFGKKESAESGSKQKAKRFMKGSFMISKVAVAVITLGLVTGVTVLAAVLKLNEDFVKTYQVSEKMEKLLFDKGVVDMPGKSIEHNGVTMTMEQCVSDQQFFYCLFRLDLPETVSIDKTGKISGTLNGKELDGYLNFSEFEVMGYKEEDDVEPFGYNMIYDSDYNIMGGEHYVYIVVSGMHTTKKLEKIYDVDAYEKKYGDQAYYWYEDTLDYANAYIYNFKSCVTKEDYTKGHMTFHFKDLEFVRTDTQGSEVISGEWDFTWAEKNVKMTKTYELNQKMSKGYYKKGKSRLTEVRIGPLSMCTLWNYDKNEAIMPPDITAIEYKNGEIKKYEENSSPIKSIYSMDRWYDEESRKYQRLDYIEFNQVVNPEDVVAVYYGAERIELQ